MRRSPAIGIPPRASTPSPSPSCRTYAHDLFLSRLVYPPPFFSSRSLTPLTLPTSLSFLPAFHPRLLIPDSPICLIFFSRLPDHLPTPRVGVLFLSGRSSRPSARPRTHVHTRGRSTTSARGRDGEIKKGVKGSRLRVEKEGRGVREESGGGWTGVGGDRKSVV